MGAVQFWHSHGMISKESRDGILEYCDAGKVGPLFSRLEERFEDINDDDGGGDDDNNGIKKEGLHKKEIETDHVMAMSVSVYYSWMRIEHQSEPVKFQQQ